MWNLRHCGVWLHRLSRWAVVGLVLWWPLDAGYGQSARQPLQLLSTTDAHQLALTDQEWHQVRRSRSAGLTDGPHIVIEKPALKQSAEGPTIETTTPASLAISFEPNRAPVNMSSLEVTARKGFFSKSLTDLLKPYVKGTALQVQDVSIPEGKFRIEVAITDTGGAKTVETYRLQVGQ